MSADCVEKNWPGTSNVSIVFIASHNSTLQNEINSSTLLRRAISRGCAHKVSFFRIERMYWNGCTSLIRSNSRGKIFCELEQWLNKQWINRCSIYVYITSIHAPLDCKNIIIHHRVFIAFSWAGHWSVFRN